MYNACYAHAHGATAACRLSELSDAGTMVNGKQQVRAKTKAGETNRRSVAR